MKTSYFAIAAVGLAAAVLCNLRYGKNETQMLPSYPVPSVPARPETVELPPLPTIPKASFPEINPPPDGSLVIPASSNPIITLPSIPGSGESQASQLIELPAIPLPVPQGTPTETVSAAPGVLPFEQIPSSPAVPSVPVIPQPPMALPVSPPSPPPTNPNKPAASNPLTAPSPPVPVSLPKPPLSMEPADSSTTFTPHGKFVVLKGKETDAAPEKKIMACKLIAIEGIGAVDKKDIVVQQGAIVRNIPRTEVLFVGETHNDVYRFMRDRVVPGNDEVVRLALARWCMFNGMREQALAETTAILQFKPGSKHAADLARSLEESLKQFPADGSTAAAKQPDVKPIKVAEGEIDVAPEAATAFPTRIQPILANLCVDCHARPDHSGTFKLTRITGYEVGPQSSLANLRATAGQLLRTDPLNSPLLSKAITAHGGLRQPPFQSRQAAGFRALENWVTLAVGMGSVAPMNGNPTTAPNAQPTPPAIVSTPPSGLPSTQPGAPTVPTILPPVETPPALPATNPATTPGVSLPMVPSVPVAPPVVNVPTVKPTPPTMKPTVPTQPPVIPLVDMASTLPAIPMVPTQPTVPAQPSISLPQIPSVPSGMIPVSIPTPGSQFGKDAPPKPMPSSGPSGDEFDPSNFNRGVPRK